MSNMKTEDDKHPVECINETESSSGMAASGLIDKLTLKGINTADHGMSSKWMQLSMPSLV